MMGYFVDDIADQLALHYGDDGWQARHLLLLYTMVQKLTVHLTGNRSVITLHHVNTRSC